MFMNNTKENKSIFVLNSIPFKEIDDTQILIETQENNYFVYLDGFNGNPFVLKMLVTPNNSIDVVSKEAFVRKMCRYFKKDFVHWDNKKTNVHAQYQKKIPNEIVIGGEYTTSWATPLTKWVLVQILGKNVILKTIKTKKEIYTTIDDLRVWEKTN